MIHPRFVRYLFKINLLLWILGTLTIKFPLYYVPEKEHLCNYENTPFLLHTPGIRLREINEYVK